MWHIESSDVVETFSEHGSSVNMLCMTSFLNGDVHLAVTGDASGQLGVFVIKGQAVKFQHKFTEHDDAINDMCTREDRAFTASRDGTLRCFDLA